MKSRVLLTLSLLLAATPRPSRPSVPPQFQICRAGTGLLRSMRAAAQPFCPVRGFPGGPVRCGRRRQQQRVGVWCRAKSRRRRAPAPTIVPAMATAIPRPGRRMSTMSSTTSRIWSVQRSLAPVVAYGRPFHCRTSMARCSRRRRYRTLLLASCWSIPPSLPTNSRRCRRPFRRPAAAGFQDKMFAGLVAQIAQCENPGAEAALSRRRHRRVRQRHCVADRAFGRTAAWGGIIVKQISTATLLRGGTAPNSRALRRR